MRTRGEGFKKSENFADITDGSSVRFIKVLVLTKSRLYWRSEWRVNFYAAMESTSQRHVPSFLWKCSIDRAYYQGVKKKED